MKFLVALDGSDESDTALEYAIDMADAMNASLIGVHSVDPVLSNLGGMEPIATISDADERLVLESIEDAETRGLKILEEAERRAENAGTSLESDLTYGDPAEEIPTFANEVGADAIVVGHRGRSQRASEMLGSVAKRIVERASVPVTVVR